MGIESRIKEWFEKTQRKLSKVEMGSDVVNGFCRSVLAVLKTYCDATLFLLRPEIDLKLPAMANLRIMSELIIKFLWCLNVEKNDEIEERIERWEKTGVISRRKFVEELLKSEGSFDSTTAVKFKQELDKLNKYMKENIKKAMPDVTGEGGLFEQTKNIFDRNICPQAYKQFNPAIHVDTLVLTWSVKRKEDAIYYTGDLDENIDTLKIHCLSFSYMLIKVICKHYGWKFEQIEKEYHELVNKREKDGK